MPKLADRQVRSIFDLSEEGPHLWTREKAKNIRVKVETALEKLPFGGVLTIDAIGVEVFDYSFAAELFGKLVLSLSSEFPNKHVIISGLNDYTRENLNVSLERVGAILLEVRSDGSWELLGKVSPSDEGTLKALEDAARPIGAPELAKKLSINVTACNERLTKLLQFGLINRAGAGSGRLQYLYTFILC